MVVICICWDWYRSVINISSDFVKQIKFDVCYHCLIEIEIKRPRINQQSLCCRYSIMITPNLSNIWWSHRNWESLTKKLEFIYYIVRTLYFLIIYHELWIYTNILNYSEKTVDLMNSQCTYIFAERFSFQSLYKHRFI